MRVLFVHPSALMYSEVFLRLDPIGLELVAASARRAGHTCRLLDLQIFSHADFRRELEQFRPEAVAFSLNFLANVPEVIDLAKQVKRQLPGIFVFVGGHSASFIAGDLLEQAGDAIDAVVRGEGEAITPRLLERMEAGGCMRELPGVVTPQGQGPPPELVPSLDDLRPARDLARRRHKYFIGALDPCASIEFSRGCPWDCSFCSAWTFYGRSYRKVDPEVIAEDLAHIREPNVFIVDDVAFIDAEHGHAVADAVAKRRIRKQYYLETRADVLLRHPELFARWKQLGLLYLFLGVEALDEEGLRLFRKRVTVSKNFEALEVARKLGVRVAVNLIVDPSWDARRFAVVQEWAQSVPEIVHLTVNTPYPGTETWRTEARRLTTDDYRLFDIQHAVLPTTLPLSDFYRLLVETQQILNHKHLRWANLKDLAVLATTLLARGQTNFVSIPWKFNRVYNPARLLAEHEQPVHYRLRRPAERSPPSIDRGRRDELYVHAPRVSGGTQRQ
jgi:hopanoid C-3 methylase HpnR